MDKFKAYFEIPIVIRISYFLIGIIVVWVIVKFVQRKLLSKIKNNDSHYKAKKISGFVGYFLTVILLLFVFKDKLSGFSVALGVAGAGVAFAMQEVIVSFAGWLAILFGGFYKTGDRVQLGGIKGDVMDINVIRTTIMETGEWVSGDLYNGRIVLVANSFVFKEPVFNYSGDFPFLWDEIKIPIHYGSDYEEAKNIILQAGKEIAGDIGDKTRKQWKALQNKYLLEDATTDPMVSLVANDNWVEFTLRYAVNYRKRRITKTDLFMYILKNVELTQGRVKFASATFELTEIPDIKVSLAKNEK
jgi:small-conductance mechanosensitive channel|tara:strand:- start:23327 stop:24232 length:906 start_codon:yes stop_codon:yes gene_type:complete